jgi:hypothetical protein
MEMDENALGGEARRRHRKFAFKKGLTAGLAVGALVIGGGAYAGTSTYQSQEQMVHAYEIMHNSDLYEMSAVRSSVLYQKLEDSPAANSPSWKSYVDTVNTLDAGQVAALNKEKKEFADSVIFPDLKSRISEVIKFNERMAEKKYPFGFNDYRPEKELFSDINKSCDAKIQWDDDNTPKFINSRGEKTTFMSARIFIDGPTYMEQRSVKPEERKLIEEGFMPVLEEGKRLFCPKV